MDNSTAAGSVDTTYNWTDAVTGSVGGGDGGVTATQESAVLTGFDAFCGEVFLVKDRFLLLLCCCCCCCGGGGGDGSGGGCGDDIEDYPNYRSFLLLCCCCGGGTTAQTFMPF